MGNWGGIDARRLTLTQVAVGGLASILRRSLNLSLYCYIVLEMRER